MGGQEEKLLEEDVEEQFREEEDAEEQLCGEEDVKGHFVEKKIEKSSCVGKMWKSSCVEKFGRATCGEEDVKDLFRDFLTCGEEDVQELFREAGRTNENPKQTEGRCESDEERSGDGVT